ncbi:MAG TPA: cobalamin biosynthesis protein, partial [Micromonosporaceae bacterium]|nr:cobalamin biosynthesis protein [Micromonosporaceae bacterium]
MVSDDLADLRDDPRDDLRDAPLTEDVLHEQTRALPIVVTGLTIRPGMDLPIHDDEARAAAEAHLSNLEIPGSGLGLLSRIVVFAAGTQSRGVPTPWAQPHMLLLHGSHEGDVAAGDDAAESAQIAAATQRGEGSLGMLVAEQGVNVKVIDTPAAGDIAYGRAAAPEVVDSMLKEGWRLVDEAVDSGADLIIVGSCGSGADATAATVVSKVTGAEIAGLLGRVVGPDGTVDDSAWMLRCAAARDALHRTRNSDLNADTLLAELGGPDLALIAGVIVGATARRTPVMLDGPVGTAAALLARDLGSQSRLWSTLPDHGGHPTTKAAADVLGLTPLLDLKAGLGEGSVSLLALPLLRSALRLPAPPPPRGSGEHTAETPSPFGYRMPP